MGFEFQRLVPSGPLARWVGVVWFARGRIRYAREHIAPTGSTVAVLNLGDPIVHATFGPRASQIRATTGWISGPHDRPSLNEPLGVTHCYGVVSTPIGCLPLFGLDPRAIRGRVVPLRDWPGGIGIRSSLDGLPPETGLRRLLAALEDGLAAAPARVERMARAAERLEADPAVPVGDLAAAVGVSHAHLDREFRRVVGLGPRRLAAILRVRRLLEGLDVLADPDWSTLAAAHGWYDQSHMIRDFKRYTGVTPTAYVAAQRAHFDASEVADASGFVPVPRD